MFGIQLPTFNYKKWEIILYATPTLLLPNKTMLISGEVDIEPCT